MYVSQTRLATIRLCYKLWPGLRTWSSLWNFPVI